MRKNVIFIAFLTFSISAQAQDGDHTSSSPSEGFSDTQCATVVSNRDLQLIEEFNKEIASIEGLKDNETLYRRRIEEISKSYATKISPAALQSLRASQMRSELEQTVQHLESNPEAAKSFLEIQEELGEFAEILAEHEEARKTYQGRSGFFGGVSNTARRVIQGDRFEQRFNDSANRVTTSNHALTNKIRNSDLPEDMKQNLIRTLNNTTRAELQADSASIDAVISRLDRQHSGLTLTRNAAIGSGLIVGSFLTGGLAAPAAMSAFTATGGSTVAGVLTGAAVTGAAGAAGGAGYATMRSSLKDTFTAALSDDDFFCALAREQSESQQHILREALVYAAIGGGIGFGVGGGLVAGGTAATVTLGLGTGAAIAGTGASIWGATTQGIEARNLFEKAQLLAEEGDEQGAREALNEARKLTAEAGLSTIDAVLAGIASQRSFSSFRNALRSPPPTLTNRAVEALAPRVASEMHKDWRNNYRRDLVAQGQSPDTPRFKNVPASAMRANETPQQALRRLEASGHSGLRVENGALQQNINQGSERIVPALNMQLNGAPARDYAQLMIGRELRNQNDVESLASDVHRIWMRHNEWQRASNPDLFRDYSQLPASEKVKDVDVIVQVLRGVSNEGRIAPAHEALITQYRQSLLGNP